MVGAAPRCTSTRKNLSMLTWQDGGMPEADPERRVYTPWAYQDIITGHILDTPRCAVWATMGMGKTAPVLTALDALFLAGEEQRVERGEHRRGLAHPHRRPHGAPGGVEDVAGDDVLIRPRRIDSAFGIGFRHSAILPRKHRQVFSCRGTARCSPNHSAA